jgi:hypothetical protein
MLELLDCVCGGEGGIVVMLNWAVLGIVCREGGYGKAEG